MNFKRGLRVPRPGAVKMRFASYFNAANLPQPPVKFGKPELVTAWGMLGNDRYGDCYWAGSAHESMMLEAAAGNGIAIFTTSNALADYSAATGFSSSDTSTDQGTDLLEGAKYRQKTGIVDMNGKRHTIDVYAGLDAGNLNQLALAVDILGIAGVGVALPDNAEDQFDELVPWDVTDRHPPDPNDGHYIPCVGRNSVGNFLFISWGRLHAATPRWVSACMNQGMAYLSREALSSAGYSPGGLNLAKLNDDFNQLTGAA